MPALDCHVTFWLPHQPAECTRYPLMLLVHPLVPLDDEQLDSAECPRPREQQVGEQAEFETLNVDLEG